MMGRDCRLPIANCQLKDADTARVVCFHSAIGNRQMAIPSHRHSAFSFIEVLFAVILLGIGFIMIAGIFPVAIQQTAAVSNETQGTLVIRDAIKKIQAAADAQVAAAPAAAGTTNSIFQPTMVGGPTVQAFSPNIMQAVGNDPFFTADHRFGWVGFYRRDFASSPFAQVFVIALENPNFPNYMSQYMPGETTQFSPMPPILPTVAPPIPPALYNYASPSTYTAPSIPPAAPLPGVAATISASFYYNTDGSTTAVVTYPSTQTSANGATGAFVLIASNLSPAATANMVGRFFRLGNAAGASALPASFSPPVGQLYQIFLLQPGWDITPADAATNSFTPGASTAAFSANVWIIGAAPATTPGSVTEFTGPFTGPNQDIGAASAFIRINTANN
jgi:type II secretory pathway pseudopilin PulG